MMHPADNMAMRTTVTLDPDVAAKVKAEMRRTGRSFKEVLNSMVRKGTVQSSEKEVKEPFRVIARNLGHRPGLNYDNIGELLEQIEGPFHK